LEGTGKGTDTPIGVVPTEEALDISGLDISHDDLINSIKFEADEWREEIPMIADWLATFGDKLPQAMSDELQDLRNRLGFSETIHQPVTQLWARLMHIMTLRDEATGILSELVGKPAEFHDGQFEVIEAIVDQRRRGLVVERTGWGKSAVYFVATALLRRRGAGPTLIISPL